MLPIEARLPPLSHRRDASTGKLSNRLYFIFTDGITSLPN
jgi:hypothetical protein